MTMQIEEEGKPMEAAAGRTVRSAGALGSLIALGAALLFAAAASGTGTVARYGGAVWVFILTWIILMPVLAPWMKARSQA